MVTEDGHESSRALLVSGRTQGWNGVEKDLTGAQVEGRTVEVTCWMKNNEDRPIVLAATMSEENSSRQVVYNTLVQTQEVAPGAWILEKYRWQKIHSGRFYILSLQMIQLLLPLMM